MIISLLFITLTLQSHRQIPFYCLTGQRATSHANTFLPPKEFFCLRCHILLHSWGRVTQAKESKGLKQAVRSRNRTRDPQNDHAERLRVRTLDLQKHCVHEEHKTYTDRIQKIQISHVTSMWNMYVVWRMMDRPFNDDTSIQKICSMQIISFYHIIYQACADLYISCRIEVECIPQKYSSCRLHDECMIIVFCQ